MNRVSYLLIMCLFAGTGTLLNAQTFWQSKKGEQPIRQSFSELELSFRDWTADKKLQDEKGWKYMGRWLDFQARRLDGAGKMPLASQVNQGMREAEAMRQQAAMHKTSSHGAWSPVGPFDYPTAFNSSWEEGMGRINCITFHPTNASTYWVGVAQGGVWKTTDNGGSWVPLTDDLPMIRVSDIALNPNNPNEMYISMGDYAYIGVALETDDRKRHTHYGLGVYKTTDGGANWAPTGLSFANTDFDGSLTRRVMVSSTNAQHVVAVGTHGAWKSIDGGANWAKTSDSLFWDLEQDPNNPNTLYASTGYVANLNQGSCGIYKSTNFGTTWTALNTGIPAQGVAGRVELAIAPSNTNYIYAVCTDMARGFYACYRSTNGGTSWTQQSTSPNILHWYEGNGTGGQGTYDLVLMVDAADENKLYAGGINIWGSTDGGASWDGVSYWRNDYGQSIHADQHQLKRNPLNNQIFICNDGGLYSTSAIQIGSWTDALYTPGYAWPTIWTRHSSGMNVTSFYRVSISEANPGLIIAGAQDNSTYYFDGLAWVNIIGGDGMNCQLHPTTPGTLWGSYQYGNLANSYDGGFTINYGLNYDIYELGEWVTPFVLDPTDPSTLYAGYGNVWKSTNDGFNWVPISNFPNIPALGNVPNLCSDLMVAPSDPNYIYVTKRVYHSIGANAGVLVTTNGGATWADVSMGLPDSLYFTSVRVDGDDPRTAWVTCGGFSPGVKVFKTTDAGGTWTNISQNLPNLPVNIIAEHTGKLHNPIYVGTDVGVYYYNDTLSGWEPYATDLPNVIVSDLDISYSEEKLYAATFGRGLWGVDVRDHTSSAVAGGLPATQMQIAPNPGTGTFTLRLQGKQLGAATLKMLDVNGRTVYTREISPSGGQYEEFVSTNLPAGLYFVQVTDGKSTQSMRYVIQ